jgi:hypothetical protein
VGEKRENVTLLAIDLFRIINWIDIDYNFKWKVNTNVSVAHKIAVILFMAHVWPAELVPIVDEADLFH